MFGRLCLIFFLLWEVMNVRFSFGIEWISGVWKVLLMNLQLIRVIFIVLLFIRFFMLLSVSNMYREGGVIFQFSSGMIKKKMVNVVEFGYLLWFVVVEFGMVCYQLVFGVGGQYGVFNVGISFLVGVQFQFGMECVGVENGDIGLVVGDQ